MKKFILNTIIFVLIFFSVIFICSLFTSQIVKAKDFNNYNTESNTLVFKEKTYYDILFMGISHARVFSRDKNHIRMENILDSKIINIGQGGGICGVNEQLFYLDYFFHKGNKTAKIIYVLSPPLLFSETLPISSKTFRNESFELSFLMRYLAFKSENKSARIIDYLQFKLHPMWLMYNPQISEGNFSEMDSLNIENVEKGQNKAYSGPGLNFKRFDQSIEIVEQTIRLGKKNDSDIILLIPPALFGKWRGHKETLDFAKSMKKKYSNVKIFDSSESIMKPELYYDSHHLNSKGISFFIEKNLKPFILGYEQ